MNFRERIGLWYLKRRIMAAYKKGLKMQPLPKWVNWIGNLGSLAALLAALGGVIPGKVGICIAAAGAWLNSVSHSLPGTGGK